MKDDKLTAAQEILAHIEENDELIRQLETQLKLKFPAPHRHGGRGVEVSIRPSHVILSGGKLTHEEAVETAHWLLRMLGEGE